MSSDLKAMSWNQLLQSSTVHTLMIHQLNTWCLCMISACSLARRSLQSTLINISLKTDTWHQYWVIGKVMLTECTCSGNNKTLNTCIYCLRILIWHEVQDNLEVCMTWQQDREKFARVTLLKNLSTNFHRIPWQRIQKCYANTFRNKDMKDIWHNCKLHGDRKIGKHESKCRYTNTCTDRTFWFWLRRSSRGDGWLRRSSRGDGDWVTLIKLRCKIKSNSSTMSVVVDAVPWLEEET